MRRCYLPRHMLAVVTAVVVIGAGGCGYDEEKPIFMAPGSYGDIAIVVSSDAMVGAAKTLGDELNVAYRFVINREMLFNIDVYGPRQWDLSRNYKNIIFLWRVGDGGPVEKVLRDQLSDAGEARAAEPKGALIELEQPFASYQHAVVITGQDRNSLLSSARARADDLRQLFERESQSRIMRRYRHEGLNEQLMAQVWRKHRFFMEIPGGFQLNQDEPDGYPGVELMKTAPSRGITVAWSQSVDPGLIAEYKPLLIELRREMGLKMHGEDIVEDSFVWKEDTVGDLPALRLEGAWTSRRFEGGGPFWSWFVADPERQRVICIDALCYAPGMDKMDIFRRLRAVVQTFSLDRPQP
ncbi:DUF4837 family protein [bacterium]|nr:DUF4837 family protein [bacterium]